MQDFNCSDLPKKWHSRDFYFGKYIHIHMHNLTIQDLKKQLNLLIFKAEEINGFALRIAYVQQRERDVNERVWTSKLVHMRRRLCLFRYILQENIFVLICNKSVLLWLKQKWLCAHTLWKLNIRTKLKHPVKIVE